MPLRFRNSLSVRLIFWVGLILLIGFSIWSYFDIAYHKRQALKNTITGANKLGNIVKLETNAAMRLNARNNINPMLHRIARQEGIEDIRIYDKRGRITYSNNTREIGKQTNIKEEACALCHGTDPPLEEVNLEQRTRIFDSPLGYRFLGIITPIYNEPGCAAKTCHEAPEKKKILGELDVVVSLEQLHKGFLPHEKAIIALALVIFLGTAGFIGFFIMRFVNRPIKELIAGTMHIGQGDYGHKIKIDGNDEIGQLGMAINQMGRQIGEKQEELNKQKEEYRNLFEHAPCYITVQDKDFKLLRYNREFEETFDPKAGEYCYQAYKGRSERCEICPVVGTFEDGQPRTSEEMGTNKDGTRSFWMVRTSPIKDTEGNVVAAMEMSLDVTQMKFLENEVRKSEEKYRTIFNTIPNPIFVLDGETLDILDCNDSVAAVYGFGKEETLMTSFLNFFEESERENYAEDMKSLRTLNQVRQIRKDKKTIYVNVYVSSSEYAERKVLLVTTSDITARMMAEQQLIQASKMATLGVMATGVAHELNQPLSVIKTASNFILKKVRKKEAIKDEIMDTLATEMDSYVDRASKIINHLREFGRQSEVKKAEVQVNEALEKALEIFSQQLKLREIEVEKDLQEDLPPVMADSNRLEQIFINLLTNARDAIEERWANTHHEAGDKKISLKTTAGDGMVIIQVKDTGTGIPEFIRDKIFDPFFTTKKAGTGTGIGLSISFGIVQDYEGAISVETEAGVGSTFIIKFPTAGTNR